MKFDTYYYLVNYICASFVTLIRGVMAAKTTESREQAFYRIRQSIAEDSKKFILSACIIREH